MSTRTSVNDVAAARIGVGGQSLWAADADHADRLLKRAIGALEIWLCNQSCKDGNGRLRSGKVAGSSGFPFGVVTRYYLGVGRAAVDEHLLAVLHRLRRWVIAADYRSQRDWRLLAQWLPSTVDQKTGDYHSYMMASLLNDVIRGAADPDRLMTELVTGLAADLVRAELGPVRAGRVDGRQQQRLQASLLMLMSAGRLAQPRLAGQAGPLTGGRIRLLGMTGTAELAEDSAARLFDHLSARVKTTVERSMLPVTTEHDEYSFIRTLQIFETLYRQVRRRLANARDALLRVDAGLASAEVSQALARLALSPALYRVITTLSPESFAVIRQHTVGRSAIQSRAYRQIEFLCAARDARTLAPQVPRVDTGGLTVEDAFLAASPRLAPSETWLLVKNLQELDAVWRAMKRTHWGITLKIIGTVPGTGGTTGAEYLKATAEVPLFPRLCNRR